MAATTYTYSINDDTANGKVAPEKLQTEIEASSISTDLSLIDTSDDNLLIKFVDELSSGDETTLDSLVAAHDGVPLVKMTGNKLELSWTDFKAQVNLRGLLIQEFAMNAGYYFLLAYDTITLFSCTITKTTPKNADQTDYEDNFQDNANTPMDPRDADGKRMYRHSETNANWGYAPRALDFTTSKWKSLYNRKHDGAGISDGTDYGDAWEHYYDSNGDELSYQQTGYESETEAQFQSRLDSNCIKTMISFEKESDMDIFGAKLWFKNTPSTDAYLWVIAAPDIPESYGGSVAFMQGGMNLKFFSDKDCFECDGKTTKLVKYDPTYHSGKLDIIIKHAAGAKIDVQMLYQYYEE